MITITTDVQRKETRELKIATPSFWKEPTTAYDSYCAVVDEKTFVEISRLWDGDVLRVEHSTVERRSGKIVQAFDEWTPISESEFMAVYDDAWEAMRLKPALIDTGSNEAIMQHQRENRY